MKFRYLFVLMITFSSFAHAQLGVNGLVVNPTGSRDYVLKTGYGGGIQFSTITFDSQFFITFYINYYNHTFERDTFYSYGYTSNLNQTGKPGFDEGYDVYSGYHGWFIGNRIDYRIFDWDFSPTVGADVSVIGEDYYHDYKNIGVEGSAGESFIYVGLSPSLGLSYMYEDFHFFLNTNYQIMISPHGFPKQWITSFSVVYIY